MWLHLRRGGALLIRGGSPLKFFLRGSAKKTKRNEEARFRGRPKRGQGQSVLKGPRVKKGLL